MASLLLAYGGTTLTIGPGITVRGQQGTIGYNPNFGGPQNISVVNQGTISSDSGGTILVNAQPFINQGLAQGINGGTLALIGSTSNTGTLNVAAGSTLNLGGSWTNAGTFNATNATVGLGGTFILADLGSFSAQSNSINLTGTLNNTNNTLL